MTTNEISAKISLFFCTAVVGCEEGINESNSFRMITLPVHLREQMVDWLRIKIQPIIHSFSQKNSFSSMSM
jgi:hypothetical protein